MIILLVRLIILGDGRGLANGHYQAIFVTKLGATINFNSTFTCFYMPVDLFHFICMYLGRDIITNRES